MSIIRVRKDERYFTASNEPFNDQRLSWEARGLMGYLLSKPNNWEIRQKDLEAQGPAGDHKLRRMLAELRGCGYINRIRITLPDGTFEWTTEVYESPSQNPTPSQDVTTRRFSTSGSSTSGKPPDVLNTDSTSTESDDEDDATRVFENAGKSETPATGDVKERTAKLAQLHQDNIGLITPLLAEILRNAAIDYPVMTWYEEAFKIAVKNGARSWSYVDAILAGWKQHGYGWKPQKYGGNGNAKKGNSNGNRSGRPNLDDGFMEEYEAKRKRAQQQQGAI